MLRGPSGPGGVVPGSQNREASLIGREAFADDCLEVHDHEVVVRRHPLDPTDERPTGDHETSFFQNFSLNRFLNRLQRFNSSTRHRPEPDSRRSGPLHEEKVPINYNYRADG